MALTAKCLRPDCRELGDTAFHGFCSAWCRCFKTEPGSKPIPKLMYCANGGCRNPPLEGERYCSRECELMDDCMTRMSLL